MNLHEVYEDAQRLIEKYDIHPKDRLKFVKKFVWNNYVLKAKGLYSADVLSS